MSLKSFVSNVWKKLLSFVKKTYKKVDELANKLCPVAIDVVEAMKKINDGPHLTRTTRMLILIL